ncbi:MAG: DUF2264 domain-containing protein [Dysgonamonadaceae bacterium]|jgi:hypothetical protein|nr:DUF2264 domain-containing protein [Dysgonamonadaceae bacterium]
MKRQFLFSAFLFLFSCSFQSYSQKKEEIPQQSDREYWVDLLCKISEPVLQNISKGELKKNMIVELSPTWDKRNQDVTYAETFGRLMAGIAPWFNLPDDETSEGQKRSRMRKWALAGYANAVNPANPDYLLWKGHSQILVDASYIAQSFMRAPKALWEPLDDVTKQRYINEFKGLRSVRASYSNWLLFRGMIEAFLLSIGEEYDAFALDLSIRKMEEWYVGDGWYSDGPEYSLDYYNSYVIHPMLVEILEEMKKSKIWSAISFDLALRRMQRYNELLERLISPEATFPVIGRSMTYRMGAFQPLALAAWKYGLPSTMTEGQVRNALTSIMKRMFSVEENFNEGGFLQLGFIGHQPNLADYYTNNGSLYMTSLSFMPLGLPPEHSFWTSPAEEWTSLKAWKGEMFRKDYHQSVKK